MKRAAFSFAIAITVVVSPFARADDNFTTLSNAQLALIRTNCVAIHSTLDRIHANDALSRVNLGREYETISTKLMAPMNSRIALNNLDGSDVTKTTADFNNQLEKFRSAYQTYEQTMTRALETECAKNPADLYKTIEHARIDRGNVRATVVELSILIAQYKIQLKVVQQQAKKTTSQGVSQ